MNSCFRFQVRVLRFPLSEFPVELKLESSLGIATECVLSPPDMLQVLNCLE